jgi:hypothetical protein
MVWKMLFSELLADEYIFTDSFIIIDSLLVLFIAIAFSLNAVCYQMFTVQNQWKWKANNIQV